MEIEADELGKTEVPVPTVYIACGNDCGITFRVDETGIPGKNDLCGICNYRITTEVEKMALT